MTEDIRQRLLTTDRITVDDTNEMMDFETYGSMGCLSMVVKMLLTLQERIKRGDIITHEEGKEVFTERSFKKYVESHFSAYVIKELYKETRLLKDVYFKLNNTEQGLDVIYKEGRPQKLFKWICNIDETYSLVYLRFNHVVYVQNRRTQDLELLYSEHNNCYIYDEEDGKIKEVFK